MTCAALLSIIDDTRLTATEKVIFGNIVKGYRKRADIARASRCAESSVPRAVRKLEMRGFLRREFEDGKANRYVITADTGIPNDTPLAADTGIVQDTGIAKATPCGDTGIPIDTGFEGGRGSSDTPLPVDKSPRAYISTRARADTQKTNTNTLEILSEREEPLEPAAFARARDAAKVLNGKARSMPAHELAMVIVERVNSPWLDPHKSQQLITTAARIHAWIRDLDADFDLDILPTIRGVMARKNTAVRNWTYFDNAIRDAVANRIAADAPMLQITGTNTHDQSPRADFAANVRAPKVNASTAILLAQMQGGDRPRR